MGSCPLVFPLGQLHSDQISFGPFPPHPKIHHRDNINGVQINARDHLCLADLWWLKQTVFTLYSPRTLWTGITWYEGRCTGQPTYQRHWEGCYFAIMQNSGTSMGVNSLLFLNFALVEHMCHHQLGALHPCDMGWLTQLTLGQPVHVALMVC